MARRDEDSLLIQSAEALGRVIGSLQRQLRNAHFPLGAPAPAAPTLRKSSSKRKTAVKVSPARKKATARARTPGGKAKASARKNARKKTPARKAAPKKK